MDVLVFKWVVELLTLGMAVFKLFTGHVSVACRSNCFAH